jgi:hypothetical protein
MCFLALPVADVVPVIGVASYSCGVWRHISIKTPSPLYGCLSHVFVSSCGVFAICLLLLCLLLRVWAECVFLLGTSYEWIRCVALCQLMCLLFHCTWRSLKVEL